MENKKVSFDFVDGTLKIAVDLNQDGQPFLKVEVNALEIPDEVLDLIKAKKEEAKAVA